MRLHRSLCGVPAEGPEFLARRPRVVDACASRDIHCTANYRLPLLTLKYLRHHHPGLRSPPHRVGFRYSAVIEHRQLSTAMAQLASCCSSTHVGARPVFGTRSRVLTASNGLGAGANAIAQRRLNKPGSWSRCETSGLQPLSPPARSGRLCLGVLQKNDQELAVTTMISLDHERA